MQRFGLKFLNYEGRHFLKTHLRGWQAVIFGMIEIIYEGQL